MSSQHGHHVIPKKVLYTVFGTLVFLTVLTAVTAEYVDIGSLNVPLALAIAGSKAALVVTFFMALKYDNKVNTLVFMFGGVFVVVFLTFTLFDTAFRGDLGNVGAETISDMQRREEAMLEREAAFGAGTAPAAEAAASDTLSDDAASGAAADTTVTDTTSADPTGAPAGAAAADTSSADG